MKKLVLLLSLFLVTLCATNSHAQTPGLLYGMSRVAGNGTYATLFSYDPVTGKDSMLVKLDGLSGRPGTSYGSQLFQATNGKLYGMAYNGGTGPGVLFYYDPVSGKDSTVIEFTGPNGAYPNGSPIQGKDGLIYGVTQEGGVSNLGTIFSYNPVTGKDSTLLSFNGTNGIWPLGTLFQASDSNLYGMTNAGGTSNLGVFFRFNPRTGNDTVLLNLSSAVGTNPMYGGVIQDTNGLLYGMMYSGGTSNAGLLFSYDIHSLTYTVNYSFNINSGWYPFTNLIQYPYNGLLYGLLHSGGDSSLGALFSYNTFTGVDTVLHSFGQYTGSVPFGSLYQATDSLLYGMTNSGGASDSGVIFSFNPATFAYKPLVSLNGKVGALPMGSLTQAMSGSITGLDSMRCATDSIGWAKVYVRGGKMPLTYSWSNGASIDSVSGLKGGNYTCIVTDARSIALTFNILMYAPPLLKITSSVSNVCFGDSNGYAFVVSSGGTPPYKYNWSTSATTDTILGLKPGTYTCLVTDANGCTSSTSCNITQATAFKIDSVVSTPTSCPTCTDGTSTVYVSGGVPPGDSAIYYYTWTYGGDSATVTGVPSGYNSVCVTSGYYKCGTACDSTLVLTGIQYLSGSAYSVKVYPVPSGGIVYINLVGEGFEKVVITDELGRDVYHSQLDSHKNHNTLQANLSAEQQGIYFVQITGVKGAITKKLVIAR